MPLLRVSPRSARALGHGEATLQERCFKHLRSILRQSIANLFLGGGFSRRVLEGASASILQTPVAKRGARAGYPLHVRVTSSEPVEVVLLPYRIGQVMLRAGPKLLMWLLVELDGM